MKRKLKLKNNFIPVNRPKIFSHDKINVKKCLDTAWLSSEGSFVKIFEKDFSTSKFYEKCLDIYLKTLN